MHVSAQSSPLGSRQPLPSPPGSPNITQPREGQTLRIFLAGGHDSEGWDLGSPGPSLAWGLIPLGSTASPARPSHSRKPVSASACVCLPGASFTVTWALSTDKTGEVGPRCPWRPPPALSPAAQGGATSSTSPGSYPPSHSPEDSSSWAPTQRWGRTRNPEPWPQRTQGLPTPSHPEHPVQPDGLCASLLAGSLETGPPRWPPA